jgi:hypothetical protein
VWKKRILPKSATSYPCKHTFGVGMPSGCAGMFHRKEGGIQVLTGQAPISRILIENTLAGKASRKIWQKVIQQIHFNGKNELNYF